MEHLPKSVMERTQVLGQNQAKRFCHWWGNKMPTVASDTTWWHQHPDDLLLGIPWERIELPSNPVLFFLRVHVISPPHPQKPSKLDITEDNKLLFQQ